MKKNTTFSLQRLLRTLVALMVIMSLLLCGCGNKDNGGDGDGGENAGNNNNSSTLLGDGDGKLEVQDVVDSASGIYGALLGAFGGNAGNAQGAQMDMVITLGDEVLEGLSQSLAQGGIETDGSWLREIGLTMETSYTTQLMQMAMDLKLGGKHVADANVIMDMVGSAVYFSVPDLSNQYLGGKVDMTDNSVAGVAASLSALMEQYGDIIGSLPTEKELNTLLNRYVDVVLKAMSAPTTGTAQLQAGGITVEATATTYTIRRSDLMNMAEAVLTTAKTDAELEKMLDAINAWYNANMEGEEMDIHQEMLNAIDSALEDLPGAREELIDQDMLRFIAYTKGEEQVGFELELIDSYSTMRMRLYNLTDGNNTALDLHIMDAFALTGTGTNNGGKHNGNYTLTVEGEDMLYVELVDFDTASVNKGKLNGTLRLRMAEGLLDEMGNNPMFNENLTIEVKLDTDRNKASITVILYENEKMGITIALNTKTISAGNIKVPTDYVNMDDSYAMQNWVASVNFSKLLSNLRNAGVPSALVDMLEQNLNGGNQDY